MAAVPKADVIAQHSRTDSGVGTQGLGGGVHRGSSLALRLLVVR